MQGLAHSNLTQFSSGIFFVPPSRTLLLGCTAMLPASQFSWVGHGEPFQSCLQPAAEFLRGWWQLQGTPTSNLKGRDLPERLLRWTEGGRHWQRASTGTTGELRDPTEASCHWAKVETVELCQLHCVTQPECSDTISVPQREKWLTLCYMGLLDANPEFSSLLFTRPGTPHRNPFSQRSWCAITM